MFPNVLQELKDFFGRDFLLGVFFPVLIFVSLSIALYLEIVQGLGAVLTVWEKLSLLTQLLLFLGGLVVILVIAFLIYYFQYSIISLFEGYWPRFLQPLRDLRTKLYERRWQFLEDLKQSILASPGGVSLKGQVRVDELEAEQFMYFPPPIHLDKMMPTRIGNILRASELYAYDHYGINSVIIWTRLRPLLPAEVVAPLVENKTARDFMLLMSSFGVAFSFIWCLVLAIFTNRWGLFLLCSLGWPFAWFCYRNAVQSAVSYGEQVKAIFDLHRKDLLTALDCPPPQDGDAERIEWTDLSLFFYRNIPLPTQPAKPETDKAQSLDEVVKALADYLKKVNAPPTP